MFTPTYIIFLMILIIAISQRNMINAIVQRKVFKKRTMEEKVEMVELAKRFIEKDCIIRVFNNNHFIGTILEVSDSAILIENKGGLETINLEFVVSIKEHPKNKKGKKKAVVS